MKPDTDIEKSLRALAARSDLLRGQTPDLPDPAVLEEDLARYYAGDMPPAEAERLGRIIAFSDEASRTLAEWDRDQTEAGRVVDRGASPLRTWVEAARRFILPTTMSTGVLRYAGAAAALLMVVGLVTQMDRAPGFPETPFHPMVGAEGKGTVVLPGGRLVTQVDPAWTLFVPQGNVAKARWFVWQPVEGAAHYELELIGSDGSSIFVQPDIQKNRLSIPTDARGRLAPGIEYRWIATAYDASQAVITRGVGRFTITD